MQVMPPGRHKAFYKRREMLYGKVRDRKTELSPGQHVDTKGKVMEYAMRLREKQRARRIYGLSEKQFKRFFVMAERKEGITGTNFLIFLERRIDNMVFRLGFATSRAEARQLVSHKHIAVNGKTVNSSSYLVRVGDVIEVRHKNLPSVINALESVVRRGVPAWIDLDKDNMKGTIKLFPTRDDITLPIKEQLIVEYYSR